MTVAWVVLMILGCLISLAAFVWLLVIAFRENTVWGLACLFIPFAALIFAVKYWDEVKLPFLGCLAGSILTVFGGIGFSMTSVNAGIEEYADLGERVAWESPNVDPIVPEEYGLAEDDDRVVEDEPSAPDEAVQGVIGARAEPDTMDHEEALKNLEEPSENLPGPRPHRDGVLVPLAKLDSLQGERIVIVLNNLERVSAYVDSVDDQTLRLVQRVGGGSVTYTIDLADIKEVRSRKVP